MSIFLFIGTATAQEGCVAPNFPDNSLNLSDGVISDQWSSIQTYANLSEFGDGGFMKFSHNSTDLFALFGSNDKKWISIEFETESSDCMTAGSDAWIFYIDHNNNVVTAVDATMKGQKLPESDAQNDLHFEATFVNDFVYIEVVRKLDTQDTTSPDMTFANGTEAILLVASNNDHFSARTQYYLAVSFSDDVGDFVPPSLGVNWKARENFFFDISLLIAPAFILTHFTLRVIINPLEHPDSIIDSTAVRAPSFKERWNSIRSSGEFKQKIQEDTDQ